uniref:Interleukin-1 n=1 Tax=Paralichthys olivaceus TaxID=8255 RepID=K7ZK35_PAROL|nr:interleukin 1 beta like 1 [Paralichthys olivaceus]
MSDFDLSQALESPLESEEKGFKSFCFDKTDVPDEVINLDTELDLRISRNPGSMKGAATLLLLANRMKNVLSQKGQSDSERCRMLMDSVIETTIVKTFENNSIGERRLDFRRLSSWECSLTDQNNKGIICKSKDLKLLALTLTAADYIHKVKFKMGTYGSPGIGQTVVLSIINHNLYISCTMNGDIAELKLEECSAEQLKVICSDGTNDRFLFFLRETGVNVKTFESVKCRGWFISTSYEKEEKPVEMCKVDSVSRVFSFKTS